MKKIYQQLWWENVPKIISGNIETDPMLDNENDKRRGLTLRFRPPSSILRKIESFLKEARELEPNQYFYPSSDIHLTILTVISGQLNLKLEDVQEKDYQSIIKDTLSQIEPITVTFKGVTASSNSILIQGFETRNHLNHLRETLRTLFKQSDLYQTIDKRYKLQTAHLTAVRFKKPLKNPRRFASFLSRSQNLQFGKCQIKKAELVFNDWYQKKAETEIIKVFKIG